MPPAVLVVPTEFHIDPERVFSLIAARHRHVFWLDSGTDAADGMSYLGWSERALVAEHPDPAVFEALRAELEHHRVPAASAGSGFALGWVGWLGYELRAVTMGEPVAHPLRYPSAAMLWVDACLAFDHATGAVSLLLAAEAEAHWAEPLLAVLREAALPAESADAAQPPAPEANPAVHWRYTDERYTELIEQCRRAIAEGDAYLLCLTNEAVVDGRFDPVAGYRALRRSSPSHHGGFIRVGEVSLLSSSPERFLEVSPDGVVETRPIKGTRPRGRTPLEDELQHRDLRESEKERAENLMIVDLMRNDLGRVCRVGSVEVPSLLQVESYAHVHQLVSCVRGRLAPGNDAIDALLACFPAGSMTGAPKLSAVRILDRLEARPRGVYSGVFGYLGRDGRADLAMVIRSIVIDPAGATIGSGGGITALSDAAAEVEEVQVKARALLRALVRAGG